jgi:hypothetical protein
VGQAPQVRRRRRAPAVRELEQPQVGHASHIRVPVSNGRSSSIAADRELCELVNAGVSANGTSDLLVANWALERGLSWAQLWVHPARANPFVSVRDVRERS